MKSGALARNCHAEDMEELACEKEGGQVYLEKIRRSLERLTGLCCDSMEKVCAFGIGNPVDGETMGVF